MNEEQRSYVNRFCMEFWQQILVLTLTPAVVVGAMTYLLKQLFERSLTRDLERFKSDLQIKQVEFQTRFSTLHEKRIEVIGELFARLVRATQCASDLVQLFQYIDSVKTLPSKRNDAFNSMLELDNYFQAHRIYLDTLICEKMDSLIQGTRSSIGFSLLDKEVTPTKQTILVCGNKHGRKWRRKSVH